MNNVKNDETKQNKFKIMKSKIFDDGFLRTLVNDFLQFLISLLDNRTDSVSEYRLCHKITSTPHELGKIILSQLGEGFLNFNGFLWPTILRSLRFFILFRPFDPYQVRYCRLLVKYDHSFLDFALLVVLFCFC